MNIFSLGFSATIDLYLHSDQSTKRSFSQVCKYFHTVANSTEGASYIHKFITDHYEFLKEASSVREFTVHTIFRWKAIFISEFHCSAHHRMINSQLVNMLWRHNTEIYLEANDDSQIPQATNYIKSQIKCWDRDEDKAFLPAMWTLLNANCEFCKSFLDNFQNGELDFKEFLKSYKFNKIILIEQTDNEGLDEFYSTAEVEEICKKGEGATSSFEKKNCQKELLLFLKKEIHEAITHFSKKLRSYDEIRNLSLIISVWKSINSNRIPIIIAGQDHILSKEVQNFSNANRVVCVSLKPYNKVRNDKPANLITDIANCLDGETDFWSEITYMLKLQSKNPQELVSFMYSNENEHVFASLKMKMKHYQYDPQNLHCWSVIPPFIYLKEVIKLEKEGLTQPSPRRHFLAQSQEKA